MFGEIEKGRMVLNDAGKMIGRWWNELKNKYANIEIDEYIVMPNHCHGIINVVDNSVGADLRVCPKQMGGHTGSPIMGGHIGSPIMGGHIGPPLRVHPNVNRPLYAMIQWFKTMTTNEYIRNVKQNRWEPFDGKLWQRDYYEHIIRNETSLQNIREYIVNNPVQWQKDDLFIK